jgi:hypothetical protein
MAPICTASPQAAQQRGGKPGPIIARDSPRERDRRERRIEDEPSGLAAEQAASSSSPPVRGRGAVGRVAPRPPQQGAGLLRAPRLEVGHGQEDRLFGRDITIAQRDSLLDAIDRLTVPAQAVEHRAEDAKELAFERLAVLRDGRRQGLDPAQGLAVVADAVRSQDQDVGQDRADDSLIDLRRMPVA